MRLLFAILLVIAFTVAGRAQIAKTIAEDVRSSEKIVTGAPFTADAITESIQMLADGTRITRSSTSKLYRDSEGRYRRDDNAKQLGIPGANVEIRQSIVILDPVAGLKYTLNSKDRTFRQGRFGEKSEFKYALKQAEAYVKNAELAAKLEEKAEQHAEKQAEKHAEQRAEQTINGKIVNGPVKGARTPHLERIEKERAVKALDSDIIKAGGTAKQESLGARNIEGVQAEGTSTTMTIPTGAIGNDREITVVYEKWYSNELRMTVLSRHSDPRFGEQTYQLTNISRVEPPASLFVPPADYTNAADKRPTVKSPHVPREPSDTIKPPIPPNKRSVSRNPEPKKPPLFPRKSKPGLF